MIICIQKNETEKNFRFTICLYLLQNNYLFDQIY